VAGRFPLYTDADIHGPVVDALKDHGWDVVRAIDTYPASNRCRRAPCGGPGIGLVVLPPRGQMVIILTR
jgi:hypothetical protein